MNVHIEGMGWLGSALAFRLNRAGVPFTWNDIDSGHVAWRASTGIVYPAGDERSQTNLRAWAGWHSSGLFPAGTVAPAAYCYAHKNPPHEGRYQVTDLGWLRVAHAQCFAVDVPAIVRAARAEFADARVDAAPAGAPRVVAHGYSPRRTGYVWGWSAAVALDIPEEVTRLAGERRIALYGKPHRFQLAYAYPIPTRPGWWWAGSSLVPQSKAGDGNTARPFEAWRGALPTLYPKARLLDAETPVQGWRPRGSADDPLGLNVDPDGTITFPPLWHSGVRWAPTLIEEAAQRLGA